VTRAFPGGQVHPLGMMTGWHAACHDARWPERGGSSMHLFAAEWGTGQVFWSMLWFFLFFIWLWLLIVVFSDIFRSRDLSGVAKALWIIFVIVVPYLGVFVYLIARGHKMQEHAVQAAQAQDAAMRQYVQQAAGTAANPAEELAKLADLKAKGVIDEAEYEQLKAKALT
jgi:putative oligomerization/nucleic acid binding protein/phospholipase D-like protein